MSDMAQDLLQSDGWERFQRALGRKTERIGGVLAIETPMPLGFLYLYSPRGSFPRHAERSPSPRHSERPKDARNLTHALQDTAKATGAIFWRAEFDGPVSEPRVMRRFVEPEWTWRTALAGSDDERMATMHEKHRYNVRLAIRKGVTVRVSSPPLPPLSSERRGGVQGGEERRYDLDSFWFLLQDTARRQGIATHPRAYYETMIRVLPGTPVYLAECQGIPVAAAIVAYHGDTATYLHGGSSYAHRAFMAPHLLHWQAMRDAKAAGMRWYDWGGIEPPAASRKLQASDWLGMTRFKMGFGGEAVHHPPMHDLVFRPGWYHLLSFLARLRN